MIYLDNAATTCPNRVALERAAEFTNELYFNPSAKYGGGLAVAKKLNAFRSELLQNIADPTQFELVFTSGGTEADNQALFCGGRRGNVVTTAGEHSAVERCCIELKNRGVEPRFAALNRDGSVNVPALLELIDEKTSLVSVVHVNNETGAINDIFEVAKAVKAKNPRTLFHSDGVQAFGKIPVRLTREIDLYSISAHKIGGLKGTGALIKRKGLALQPYLFGGGQEGNLRSGTENVYGAAVFAHAATERFICLGQTCERIKTLREMLFAALDPSLYVRLSPESGSPYILTVSVEGTRGEVLQRMLWERGVVVGTGSACSSKNRFSRILTACGHAEKILDGVLRLSFSPETTEEEVKAAAAALNDVAKEFKGKL